MQGNAYGLQYLSLSPGRAGSTIHGEPGLLQTAAYFAFGAIGRENPSVPERTGNASQQFGTPHFGLFFGCECIEVDDIVAVFSQRISREIAFYFIQGKARGDVYRFSPVAAVYLFEEGTICGSDDVGVSEIYRLFGSERIGFDYGVAYEAVAFLALEYK